MENRHLKVNLILLIGVVAMSSASIFIRWAQSGGVPSLIIAAYRLIIATLVLTVPLLHQHYWKEYATLSMKEVGALILSGLLLGLHFATWITSLAHTSVMSSVVLVTTTPLWIGFAAPIVLREKTLPLTWIAIILAMIGGIIIGLGGRINHQSTLTARGDSMALGGAIFLAGYYLIGRRIKGRINLIAYLWSVYGIAAVMLVIWSLLSGLSFTGYSDQAFLALLALGLIPQLIGHSAANYAIRHVSATMVGVATLGEPIGSTLLAIFLLKEVPSFLQFIGALFILSSVGLVTISEQRALRNKK